MATDIEIARAANKKPIQEIGAKIGIPSDHLLPYGHDKAKVSADYIKSVAGNADGNLILVTAINPTPAGEGKTTTTVGLGDGLNAIGKRAGAWNLSKDALEATTGFLLNHVIDELLPARDDGYRYANADPVTGQAAWFDLRVRLEPAAPEEAALTSPFFEPVGRPRGLPEAVGELRYGAEFREPEGGA